MGTAKMSFGQVAYLLVLGVAIPIAVWHIAAGLYHLALIAAFATVVGVAIEVTGWNPWRVSKAEPELELMDSLLAPTVPLTVRVVSARGICPLGFQRGDVWVASGEGHLSSKLCRPAVRSLGAVLQPPIGERIGQVVSCQCPLGDRELEFAVAKAA